MNLDTAHAASIFLNSHRSLTVRLRQSLITTKLIRNSEIDAVAGIREVNAGRELLVPSVGGRKGGTGRDDGGIDFVVSTDGGIGFAACEATVCGYEGGGHGEETEDDSFKDCRRHCCWMLVICIWRGD